jgi:ferrous iron transport protein B
MKRIAIAGNPNTGKTTLFNQLTGKSAKIGNYPGVTVDRQLGEIRLEKSGKVEVADVPGTYSLAARSPEEQLAILAIAGLHPMERPDAMICVVDATNLVRNLYLAVQLIELGTPIVIALNMSDMLESSGQEVDLKSMQRLLGVPVVSIAAQKGVGLEALRAKLDEVLQKPSLGQSSDHWLPEDEALLAPDVRLVEAEIPEAWWMGEENRRQSLALWALLSVDDNDELTEVPDSLRAIVTRRHKLAAASGREIDQEIIRGRYDWLDARAPQFLREVGQRATATDRIDKLILHPVAGFAIFLTVMTLVFQTLFAWSDPLIGWIEAGFGFIGDQVEGALPASVLTDLLVKGIIGGVGGVLVFLPQIILLFLFIGFMEDTGYMARVAYLMDRVMKSLGLHGRAFVPMLSGFACAVPAIMATRTMERKRDRLLTMMVVPLMTCSARLPVYGLLIAALTPVGEGSPMVQGLMLAGMYLFSTLIALVAAAVLGRTILKGVNTPLLMEMPPYRMPHWPSVAKMMWQRSSVFIKEAGTVIMICTIVMWALLSFPKHTEGELASNSIEVELSTENQAELESSTALRTSYGGQLGQLIEPTIAPLGFDWKIGVGLIGAFAAREVFVSTMAVVYGLDEGEDETSSALRDRIRAQKHPDGSKVYTPLVCISLMIFFAIACQCMSTLAVVGRETKSVFWPTFLFIYMTVLAWVLSFIAYQGGLLLGFT